jgi:hypothetical protein
MLSYETEKGGLISMIIGREAELAKLKSAAESAKAEFIAVYGRRRIPLTSNPSLRWMISSRTDLAFVGGTKSDFSLTTMQGICDIIS